MTTPMYDILYAINKQSPGGSFHLNAYKNICVHTYVCYILYLKDLQLWKVLIKMYDDAWWMLGDKYNLNLKY